MVLETVGGVVFLVLGTVAMVVGSSKLRKGKKIRSTETIPVRDAAVKDGVVEVEGTAKPAHDTPLVSPMTKTDCVAYEYNLTRGLGSDKKLVDKGTEAQPFVIDDGTGTAYVNPESADMSLSLDKVEDITLSDLPNNIATQPELRGTRIYKEGTIEVGDDVYILGSTEQSTKKDVDTQFTNSNEWFIVSNQDASGTAGQLLKRGAIFTPLGIGAWIIGLIIITGAI